MTEPFPLYLITEPFGNRDSEGGVHFAPDGRKLAPVRRIIGDYLYDSPFRPSLLGSALYHEIESFDQCNGIPALDTICRYEDHMARRISFSRHDMNEIGYLSTVGTFRNCTGLRPTFDISWSEANNGYPRGAILALGEGSPIEVISLQDDNTKDFTMTDGYKIGSVVDGKVWWAYLVNDFSKNLLPDLSAQEELVWSHEVSGVDRGSVFNIPMRFNGWLKVVFYKKKSSVPSVGAVAVSCTMSDYYGYRDYDAGMVREKLSVSTVDGFVYSFVGGVMSVKYVENVAGRIDVYRICGHEKKRN